MFGKLIVTVVILIVCNGCADIQKRNHSEPIGIVKGETRLSISSEINTDFSSEYFGMVELVLFNQKGTWLEVKNIEINISDKELRNSIKLTSGMDLENWHKAMKKKIAVERYNQSVVSTSLFLTGLVAAGAGRTSSVRAGAGIAALSLASQTVSELQYSKSNIERVGLFPSGHLLKNPDRIPPGLFLEKWLVIDTSDVRALKLLKSFELKITYSDDVSEIYNIVLLQYDNDAYTYNWQRGTLNKIRYGN